ncbi:TetR/AcrR family transcriptional regulator [Streptomyces litchfieldiae]|uniref:TetR/AcrR family transcriptional regulator n=1 Tax=Streptomyces litchfieldiae TaxID=3075543 RepID=A0ABU2MY28_9ACTN|nr:TetR/AcrR family transcriptional regulator [Streptomyces sp. DSM 44938]MDT0346534.1 TetR/AcrR family transcriptional regulator [Streptomyces sp. DSM 44938]
MTSASTRRSATRRRLYAAAVTLIAEQGYSSTTVEQIAERAGVAKGTVYYNFGSKTDFFEAMLRDGVAPLTVSLRRAARGAFERGGGSLDALDAMAGAGLAFITAHADFTRLLVAEQWRTSRAWHPTLVDLRRQVTGVVEDILQEGVKSGEFSDSLDIQLTAGALVGMVMIGALDWQTFHAGRPSEEMHAALSDLLRGRLAGD